ncbi:MAG: 50S ribosomal protein L22 [Candidatus Vogelbacteria bacterium]|nr:50S ribosomal protein L22 [Candidatus Vogelbacteria bacterium]
MRAQLANYRQSPRKVRLVADLIKGRRVSDALVQLQFLPKRAGAPIAKLIKSAVANASGESASLIIKDIRVDQGVTAKRMMPRARGSAAQILKRSSHIRVELGTKSEARSTKS